MKTFTDQDTISDISRMTYTAGSTRGVYASVSGTTTGCLTPLSEESAAANGIQYGYGFKLIMEVNQDVREGDRITVNGTIYNVRGIAKFTHGANTQYLRVVLTKPEKQ